MYWIMLLSSIYEISTDESARIHTQKIQFLLCDNVTREIFTENNYDKSFSF